MGECNYCGSSFTTQGVASYCSGACRNLAHQAKQRAREHDVWIEHVNRNAVFKRHDYTCHICQRRIDMTTGINLPESPTLDHVIPLLAKGPHAEVNLRPAHMNCNSLKGIELVGMPY